MRGTCFTLILFSNRMVVELPFGRHEQRNQKWSETLTVNECAVEKASRARNAWSELRCDVV